MYELFMGGGALRKILGFLSVPNIMKSLLQTFSNQKTFFSKQYYFIDTVQSVFFLFSEHEFSKSILELMGSIFFVMRNAADEYSYFTLNHLQYLHLRHHKVVISRGKYVYLMEKIHLLKFHSIS